MAGTNEKFVAEYATLIDNSCSTCARRNADDPGTCKAFPDGIPDEILDGKNDHKKPYPGDHGLLYAPK